MRIETRNIIERESIEIRKQLLKTFDKYWQYPAEYTMENLHSLSRRCINLAQDIWISEHQEKLC